MFENLTEHTETVHCWMVRQTDRQTERDNLKGDIGS